MSKLGVGKEYITKGRQIQGFNENKWGSITCLLVIAVIMGSNKNNFLMFGGMNITERAAEKRRLVFIVCNYTQAVVFLSVIRRHITSAFLYSPLETEP